MTIGSMIAAALICSTHLLHGVLRNSPTFKFEDLRTNDLVVIEAPPLYTAGFENDMRRLYNNVTQMGPQCAIIVQRSLRQQSAKSLWVNRWNNGGRAIA